jgi:hypothetical protein
MNTAKIKRRTSQIIKIEQNGTPAGLARTHKIINAQRDLEIQFMKICCQIRLDDFKQARSEQQRDERKLKRQSA